MEIHWGESCQFYVTPVAESEICLVLISRDRQLRVDDALNRFPALERRLANAPASSLERGGVSVSRRLQAVANRRVALVGDAAGSVDAITGEGLCLLFQHATLLADAFESDDLRRYQAEHRRLERRPELMGDLMLLLDRSRWLRRRTLQAMASRPNIFKNMLAMHTGESSIFDFATSGLALGWRLLTV